MLFNTYWVLPLLKPRLNQIFRSKGQKRCSQLWEGPQNTWDQKRLPTLHRHSRTIFFLFQTRLPLSESFLIINSALMSSACIHQKEVWLVHQNFGSQSKNQYSKHANRKTFLLCIRKQQQRKMIYSIEKSTSYFKWTINIARWIYYMQNNKQTNKQKKMPSSCCNTGLWFYF